MLSVCLNLCLIRSTYFYFSLNSLSTLIYSFVDCYKFCDVFSSSEDVWLLSSYRAFSLSFEYFSSLMWVSWRSSEIDYDFKFVFLLIDASILSVSFNLSWSSCCTDINSLTSTEGPGFL